jgi:hypothetical protein
MQDRDSEEDTDARLEEAAVMLEAMAKELRRRKKKPSKVPNATKQPNKTQLPDEGRQRKSDTKRASKGLQVGDRVELVRKRDPHIHRQGMVVKRRGGMYWDLRLDGDPKVQPCEVWRMESSLRRVDNN